MSDNPNRLYRYGPEINSHDLIKIVAILLMVVDHIGQYLLDDNLSWRLIGRGAAPLFFFLIGYTGKLRITPTLMLYGVILTFTAYVVNHQYLMNILLNFILIYVILKHFSPQRFVTAQRILFYTSCVIATLFTYTHLEYGFLGLMFAYSARLVAENDPQKDFWLLLTCTIYFLWESLFFHFYTKETYLYCFAFFTAGLFIIMRTYRLRVLRTPHFLTLPGLILARYSLEVYFYHLVLLQLFYLWRS